MCPTDETKPDAPRGDRPVTLSVYEGARREIAWLFAIADDSAQEVGRYLESGVVVVVRRDGVLVGHAQWVETTAPGVAELKSLAVVAIERRQGLGQRLVYACCDQAHRAGAKRFVVATAGADTGALRFYQRLGFRLERVERDAFTPAQGYAEGLTIDGIPLRDRVWLDREL